MTTFGGQTIPPIFVNSAGGGSNIVVDVTNTAGPGVVAIGGNIFPINPNVLRGHFRVGFEDDTGNDQIAFDQNWAGEPPIDPPDFVFNCVNQVGDPCDFGSNAYTAAFNTGCKNLSNGARWTAAAGVVRSVTLSFDMIYGNAPAPNTCPRVSIFQTLSYTITANFSG